MTEKKSTTLLVASILMIIGAALSFILLLIGGAFTALLALGSMPGAGLFVIALIISFVLVALQLITGILGASSYKKPEKAQICIIFGCISLGLAILNGIISILTSSDYSAVTLAFGLLLPALYLVGAFQLKKLQ